MHVRSEQKKQLGKRLHAMLTAPRPNTWRPPTSGSRASRSRASKAVGGCNDFDAIALKERAARVRGRGLTSGSKPNTTSG